MKNSLFFLFVILFFSFLSACDPPVRPVPKVQQEILPDCNQPKCSCESGCHCSDKCACKCAPAPTI